MEVGYVDYWEILKTVLLHPPCPKPNYQLTWELTPRIMSMTKKRVDQSWGRGIVASARGYTTNARPGPWETIIIHIFKRHDDILQNYIFVYVVNSEFMNQ